MDIGIIILIIIASLIGNIFKQSKGKGGERRNQNSNIPKIEWPPFSPLGPEGPGQLRTETLRQKVNQPKPVLRKVRGEETELRRAVKEEKEYDMDQLTTLEGRRIDIGSTYESQDIPVFSIESSVGENTVKEYGKADKKEVKVQDRSITVSPDRDNLELSFNEESLIKVIIMAEVLSPPKCRR